MQTTSRSIYFDNYFDAIEECQKRKALQACNMTSRVERSPYGGIPGAHHPGRLNVYRTQDIRQKAQAV